MKNEVSAYLHAEENRHIFALRVARIATLTALGVTEENYYSRLLARQNDWLTCLINAGDESITYDLRLISRPHPNIYTRGKLELVVMCRLEGVSKEKAQEFATNLQQLCSASFEDEYEFELVGEASELELLRCPFKVNALTEITRRAERVTLDTLRSGATKSPPGFIAGRAELETELVAKPSGDAGDSEGRSVYHIYPYLMNAAPPMLLLPAPLTPAST